MEDRTKVILRKIAKEKNKRKREKKCYKCKRKGDNNKKK